MDKVNKIQKLADHLEWKNKFLPDYSRYGGWLKINYLLEELKADDASNIGPWFLKIFVSKYDEFYVYITNFVELWSELLTFSDFDTKLKVLNPKLEGGNAKSFLDFVITLLTGKEQNLKIRTEMGTADDCYFKIKFVSAYEDVPFHWEFDGSKCTSIETKKMIFEPLLSCLLQYQRRENQLFDIILKKDQEIDYYCCRGGNSRGNTDSAKFNVSQWQKEDEISKEFFDLCLRHRMDVGSSFQNPKFRSMYSNVESVNDFMDYNQHSKIIENNLKESVIDCQMDVNANCDEIYSRNDPLTDQAQNVDVSAGQIKQEDQEKDIVSCKETNDHPPAKRRQILRL